MPKHKQRKSSMTSPMRLSIRSLMLKPCPVELFKTATLKVACFGSLSQALLPIEHVTQRINAVHLK